MRKEALTKKKKSLLSKRRESGGYIFIFPWFVGALIFFIYPFIQSIYFAFCDLSFSEDGLVKKFIGLENFRVVFFENPQVFQKLVDSVVQMLTELVLIITLSFFLSIILNQNFHGKTVARAIFALPLIVSSGVLLSIFKGSVFSQSQDALAEATIFQASGVQTMLVSAGLSQGLINTVVGWVNSLVDMLWKSGVQLIVFLSGIQSIPPSYYEVCDIEGATAWQRFWRVTFPILMPFCFLNIIYTIIDSFTYQGNPVMSQIMLYFRNLQYAFSNALALAYFVVIIIVIGIITRLFSGRIVYIDK